MNKIMKYLPFKIEKPTKDLKLKDFSTKPEHVISKEDAKALTEELGDQLEELLDFLYFAGKHSLLVVVQGMDTAGKDGTIRHIFRHCHAQGAKVASFKVPTPEEIEHDFLWRCHKQTPRKGEFVIFNRSHYEDVGVVRVHNFVPKSVWSKRFEHINNFEELLTDSGTIVLKFFLHISKEEQEERLIEREHELDDAWKLSVGDWKEREYWDDYQDAYSDAIGKCSFKSAPWMIVPADKKWYRNLIVTQALVECLSDYKKEWTDHLVEIGEEAKAELKEFRLDQDS